MMFLSTADADGHCDSTFRAGSPGFVVVLGDRRLAWPEYRGNGVMASISNISDNGNAGLLFLDFFRDIIGLHVNGRASVASDTDLRALHPDLTSDDLPGRRPERWIVIDVEEAYVHCRKHIPQLAKRDRQRVWGTDDARSKGSDFFGVGADRAVAAPPAEQPSAEQPPAEQPPAEQPPVGAPTTGWRARLMPRTHR